MEECCAVGLKHIWCIRLGIKWASSGVSRWSQAVRAHLLYFWLFEVLQPHILKVVKYDLFFCLRKFNTYFKLKKKRVQLNYCQLTKWKIKTSLKMTFAYVRWGWGWKSEDHSQESSLRSHHVGPGESGLAASTFAHWTISPSQDGI